MWGLFKGCRFPGVIALTLLLPIAVAAPVKAGNAVTSAVKEAPKQTTSSGLRKNGPAIIEAWLQKAVDARYTKEDARFKAATVEQLEKVLDAPEDKDVVNKALEARFRMPGAGEDSENVDMAQNAETEENTRQNEQEKEEIANVSEDGSDSVNVDTAEHTHTEEALHADDSKATDEKTEQDLSKAAEENTEDNSQVDSSESSGEDSDGMTFMQRLRLNKNRLHHRKHSSFLARSHAIGGDDDEDSSNTAGSADSSDDATDALGNDYDQGSVDDQKNVESSTEESKEDASESESQGDQASSKFDNTQAEEKAENPQDESDISSSDEDSSGVTLMQKPIRGNDAGLQWRLHKAHLATKVRRNRKASSNKQRSVVYQLRNAAADLERSVQKYMREDDEQAEVQRDLAHETKKLRQDVDDELSEEPAPEKKAPEKKAPEKKAPPEKEAPAQNGDSTDEKTDPYQMCKDLCKEDKGLDAESCVTDCRSYVDTGGDVDSLKEFVTDESYNEQGGESMEKKFEDMTGKKIPDCKPTIDLEVVPTFESVDKDGDHAISRIELDDWALTACVPNELAQQVFDVADSNFDEQVSKDEWKDVGEDLQTAQILDRYADHETKGEDQYEPTDVPDFQHTDANDDKLLDQDEIMKMFKDEIKKRIPNMRDEDVDKLASQHQDAVMSDMDKLDTDKDGFINEEEFNAAEDQHMGHELHEVAQNPNNLPDPDDLHREDGAASASF